MNKVIVLQARLNSSRLPGKVLLPLAGKPVLWHILERLKRPWTVDRICVATTTDTSDDELVAFLDDYGVEVVRGSEDDVLARYIQAAFATDAEIIVRATGDNPLLHPESLDDVVAYLEANPDCDYVSQRELPLGAMLEAFTRRTLEKLDYVSKDAIYREHVTFYLHDKRGHHGFNMADLSVESALRRPNLRLTMDTMEDYELISRIYDELYTEGEIIELSKVIEYLDANPNMLDLNREVVQLPSIRILEEAV